MSGSARITTIDAVDALAAAVRFAEEVRAALDEARMGTHPWCSGSSTTSGNTGTLPPAGLRNR